PSLSLRLRSCLCVCQSICILGSSACLAVFMSTWVNAFLDPFQRVAKPSLGDNLKHDDNIHRSLTVLIRVDDRPDGCKRSPQPTLVASSELRYGLDECPHDLGSLQRSRFVLWETKEK
ncbi:unnamed protein product, partial [Ectocarpus sp. 4 AP-2014]